MCPGRGGIPLVPLLYGTGQMKRGGSAVPQDLFPRFQETDMFSFERELLRQGFSDIAGTDEAGRGPLAGPVVAATVILPIDCDYQQFNDSKKLTPRTRRHLLDELKAIEAQVGIGILSEAEVDRINILQASLMAKRVMHSSMKLLRYSMR